MLRNRVDLPEPEGPMIVTTSPRLDREIYPLQHVQCPKPLVNLLETNERTVVVHCPTIPVSPLCSLSFDPVHQSDEWKGHGQILERGRDEERGIEGGAVPLAAQPIGGRIRGQ